MKKTSVFISLLVVLAILVFALLRLPQANVDLPVYSEESSSVEPMSASQEIEESSESSSEDESSDISSDTMEQDKKLSDAEARLQEVLKEAGYSSLEEALKDLQSSLPMPGGKREPAPSERLNEFNDKNGNGIMDYIEEGR